MELLACLEPEIPASVALERIMPPCDVPKVTAGLSCVQAAGILPSIDCRAGIMLIAGWLSTRECIWWAAICQTQVTGFGGLPAESDLLAKIVQWVVNPSDTTRHALGHPGDLQMATSVGMLATAVTCATGNRTPDLNNKDASPAGLAQRLAAQSVMTAADRWPAKTRNDCLIHFFNIGLDVTETMHLWKPGAIPCHPGLRHGATKARGGDKKLHNIWENWESNKLQSWLGSPPIGDE